MAAAFSIIFTISGWCFGAIDATLHEDCTPDLEFRDSVTFQQCKSQALRRLAERPPPYIDSRYSKGGAGGGAGLPFCDYLYELETSCLPLYSEACHPGRSAQVVRGMWVRQELRRSLMLLPRDQFFKCNTTARLLHHNEVAAMREMIKERDWIANSRFCRYLLTYKVVPAPNYWLYSILRCDGKCDPEDVLDIPFRVSPDVNNPPREYRKRVRVIDFREAGYLSRAMNDTVARYGGCLARLGVPDTTQQYVLGQKRDPPDYAHRMVQEEVRERACSVISAYVHDCAPLLARCLGSATREAVVTEDASWLVRELGATMARVNVSWSMEDCSVLGGPVSGTSRTFVTTSLILTLLFLVLDI